MSAFAPIQSSEDSARFERSAVTRPTNSSVTLALIWAYLAGHGAQSAINNTGTVGKQHARIHPVDYRPRRNKERQFRKHVC